MTFNLGQTTTVAHKKDDLVKVSTKPANTKVYLDGRYVGKHLFQFFVRKRFC